VEKPQVVVLDDSPGEVPAKSQQTEAIVSEDTFQMIPALVLPFPLQFHIFPIEVPDIVEQR
jgi:hypothetical protein